MTKKTIERIEGKTTGRMSEVSFLISVRGIVQGVGFRPFIYQLAARHHLNGWVYNTSEDVRIKIEGPSGSVHEFLTELPRQAPPRALIEQLSVSETDTSGCRDFRILDSVPEEGKYQLISPDIATCPECQSEIRSPANRRYRYPFTNCTNCGPRFTIIEDIPYDRPLTTMRRFKMCPSCQAEYSNPLDRRFHAQPNACPTCGPALELVDGAGRRQDVDDVIKTTAVLLRSGKVVAIKGLGGFLLACDATNTDTVDLLRQRKNRPAKPFAIMVASLEEAGRYCLLNIEERRLLLSPQSPIVLLRRRARSAISPAVAPGLKYLGVMLPYTPLHHLLLADTELPLVMTSGNLSEEPIARENAEALSRLAGIPDYYLVHNRDIYSTYDDSVTVVERGVPQLLRRARGYAPYPVKLGFDSPQVLACGAQEKSTFCLTRDRYAFISQHIGDLENVETLEHFTDTIGLYERLFRVRPQIVAHDMHPDYLSTRYAVDLAATSGQRLVPVQHHHAHIVSGMVDAGISSPVIGVAFDGTGFGPDGKIWGGEFLVADYCGYTRVGHLQYLPLAGGDAAVRKPYRTAIGYLLTLLGENSLEEDLGFLTRIDRNELDVIVQQTKRRLNTPLTSSCGRLFDAVSALIGVRSQVQYDAQAAIELEMMAHRLPGERDAYPFSVPLRDGVRVIEMEELFRALILEIASGTSPVRISARFHNTIARMISSVCRDVSKATGLTQVVLSGGVFQNRLLSRRALTLLHEEGLKVFVHHQVPCNDGGISLGQAVVGAMASS